MTLALALTSMLLFAEQSPSNRLFMQGVAQLKAGKTAEACASLERSVAAERTLPALLAHGVCLEKLGRLASAQSRYQDAKLLAAHLNDLTHETQARQRLEALDGRVPTLLVSASVPVAGLVVRLGSASYPLDGNSQSIAVDPGQQVLRFEGGSCEKWQVQVASPPFGLSSPLVVSTEAHCRRADGKQRAQPSQQAEAKRD
jgi:hypothetical protein